MITYQVISTKPTMCNYTQSTGYTYLITLLKQYKCVVFQIVTRGTLYCFTTWNRPDGCGINDRASFKRVLKASKFTDFFHAADFLQLPVVIYL